MERKRTARTRAGSHLTGGPREFKGEDAGWNGDNSVTKYHEDRGDEPTENRMWRDITVANSRNGHNGPIHGSWNAGEAELLAFDLVHHRANHDDHRQNRKKEHSDFG